MQNDITHHVFESILGEVVDLRSEVIQFRAKVESINLLRQNPGQQRQPFSVELIADSIDDYRQQIYIMTHPELGEISLFAVPLGPEKDGMRYQVVFN